MSRRENLWEKLETYVLTRMAPHSPDGSDEENAKVASIARAAEDVDRAVDAMPALRRRLPACRRGPTLELRVGGTRYDSSYVGGTKLFVRIGLYPDGRVGEVFLDTSKEGSDLRHFMNGFAIAVSLLLQYGVPVETVVHAFKNLSGGPQGDVDGADELGIMHARSMIDLVAQVLAWCDANCKKGS